MIDILYLAHNRRAFTEASLAALIENTNWNLVQTIWLYDDGSTDGTQKVLDEAVRSIPAAYELVTSTRRWGSPVAVMQHYLNRREGTTAPLVLKIDSDTIVPPKFLDACANVMEAHPELDLLGIEPPASRTPNPAGNGKRSEALELTGPITVSAGHTHGYAASQSIGGIGLMRRSAWDGRRGMDVEGTYGGFTGWQIAHSQIIKGWIAPPLNVFLLDRLPMTPWVELSREYEARGWQRRWSKYDPKDSVLWDWWISATA